MSGARWAPRMEMSEHECCLHHYWVVNQIDVVFFLTHFGMITADVVNHPVEENFLVGFILLTQDKVGRKLPIYSAHGNSTKGLEAFRAMFFSSYLDGQSETIVCGFSNQPSIRTITEYASPIIKGGKLRRLLLEPHSDMRSFNRSPKRMGAARVLSPWCVGVSVCLGGRE
ncbi:hypothetical protein AVEN_113728-1 [Araneus ventricosus]|uniref:Uncharacterized protein n=1 Tax=Araneus ventricosus TaxID=182803 RepID=A0A4Y2RMQ5_ARAVE|nr:hypothetical protein AVEN_113728-1 [Araneus ventricosus]